MSQRQSELDRAIDAVAQRLTDVEADPMLAARIVASLPARVTWFAWFTTSWAPRLAVLALAAAASLLVMNREVSPDVVAALPSTPLTTSTTFATAQRAASNAEPLARPSRTMPLEPLVPLEPLEPGKADHEFSLPGLDVEALPPMNLPAEVPIELAPLAIADLPLSGEFPDKQ